VNADQLVLDLSFFEPMQSANAKELGLELQSLGLESPSHIHQITVMHQAFKESNPSPATHSMRSQCQTTLLHNM